MRSNAKQCEAIIVLNTIIKIIILCEAKLFYDKNCEALSARDAKLFFAKQCEAIIKNNYFYHCEVAIYGRVSFAIW